MPTYINNLEAIISQKTVTSSTIKTATDLNIFETVGNWLMIEDVIVVTDSTWLAGGTALVLKANWIVFFQTAISDLGASAVKDMKGASVTGTRITVPAGTKYLSVSSTVADCTGAWTVLVTITARKLDSNSWINSI